MRAQINTGTHTHIHMRTHKYTRIHTIHSHTRAHTHKHSHAHAHMQILHAYVARVMGFAKFSVLLGMLPHLSFFLFVSLFCSA